MRRTKINAGFFVSFIINVLLNIEGAIPAVVLLILHFCLDISIWWAVGAFLLWIIYLLVWMLVLGFINKCSNIKDKPKENKNPYSSTMYKKQNEIDCE